MTYSYSKSTKSTPTAAAMNPEAKPIFQAIPIPSI